MNMRTLAAILIILFLARSSNCQITIDTLRNTSSVYCSVDPEKPHFPGGVGDALKFITQNMSIPDSVSKVLHNSNILLKITIDTTGKLTQVSVLKGIDKTVDKEILRIFSIMPNWIPGVREGKKVQETFVLPIKLNFDHKN
jgi:hypothetical protein